MARTSLEASGRSWWLLEKDISYEERLSRDLLERIYGLREELFSIRS